MKIAYSCDNSYIEQTGISIISLLENNKSVKSITIYIISKNISKDNLTILQSIIDKYNREFIVVDFRSICYDLKINSLGRHIETVYAKIFFARISNLSKILYIDSDTIINGNIHALWNIDISEYYLAAAKTLPSHEMERIGLKFGTEIFNDGVVLMNIDYCRKNNLIEKCLDLINLYQGAPPVLSEGVLNKICHEKVFFLPLKYNLMSGLYYLSRNNKKYTSEKLGVTITEIIEALETPIIVHFLSGFYNRPWNQGCTHPLKQLYYHYKSISPWNEIQLKKAEMPLRLRLIDACYKSFGCYNVDKIRTFLKK